MGKRGMIWSLPCQGRNTSFHTWQVVSPLRECLRWLCQNPAVMEEECRRNGHRRAAPLLLPRNADLGLSTWWELPAFLPEKRTCPRGRKAVLPSYTLMPPYRIVTEGFQQHLFTQKKKDAVKKPHSALWHGLGTSVCWLSTSMCCDDENLLVCEIFIINKVLRTP